jgi:hypothetical protein
MKTGLAVQDSAINGRAQSSSPESLEQMQRDLNDVIKALALLSVKRCSYCKQFFNCSEPGALFDYGQLICYGCIPDWWHSLSAQMSVADREKLEASLSGWLKKYHEAGVIREEHGKPMQSNPQEFRIAVHCTECRGSGKLLEGERCRFCKGLGTVWIVAPR